MCFSKPCVLYVSVCIYIILYATLYSLYSLNLYTLNILLLTLAGFFLSFFPCASVLVSNSIDLHIYMYILTSQIFAVLRTCTCTRKSTPTCSLSPFPMCVVVHSALEELSKRKAEKTGPFARPKM